MLVRVCVYICVCAPTCTWVWPFLFCLRFMSLLKTTETAGSWLTGSDQLHSHGLTSSGYVLKRLVAGHFKLVIDGFSTRIVFTYVSCAQSAGEQQTGKHRHHAERRPQRNAVCPVASSAAGQPGPSERAPSPLATRHKNTQVLVSCWLFLRVFTHSNNSNPSMLSLINSKLL